MEHHGCGLHLLDRRLEGRRARPFGDVGVAGRVDHPAGEDRLPTRLGLDDDAGDRVAVHDGRDI
jgi:hypothetical protein